MLPATLHVSRKTGLMAVARKIRIYVDKVLVGDVREGKTLTVQIAPGPHVIHARMDWWYAPPVSVQAFPGGTVAFDLVLGDVSHPKFVIGSMIPFLKMDAFELRPLMPLAPPPTPYPR